MRFSIRDLLWATLVVAMGLGWWVDNRENWVMRRAAAAQAHRLRDFVVKTKDASDQLDNAVRVTQIQKAIESQGRSYPYIADWSILDERIIEP